MATANHLTGPISPVSFATGCEYVDSLALHPCGQQPETIAYRCDHCGFLCSRCLESPCTLTGGFHIMMEAAAVTLRYASQLGLFGSEAVERAA